MSGIKHNLNNIRKNLKDGVELVVVSKYQTIDDTKTAYDCGERVFGESREQELRLKHQTLPKDISWHFIGHLQRNKVKLIIPYVSMIQTVDSLRLLNEIEKQAERINRCVDVLLELHLAQEDTKSGMTIQECKDLLATKCWSKMQHIRIRGIMTMASNTNDTEQIASEFRRADLFFQEIKSEYFPQDDSFSIKSYGMSGDYIVAMKNGATMVRIGSSIFAE